MPRTLARMTRLARTLARDLLRASLGFLKKCYVMQAVDLSLKQAYDYLMWSLRFKIQKEHYQ